LNSLTVGCAFKKKGYEDPLNSWTRRLTLVSKKTGRPVKIVSSRVGQSADRPLLVAVAVSAHTHCAASHVLGFTQSFFSERPLCANLREFFPHFMHRCFPQCRQLISENEVKLETI